MMTGPAYDLIKAFGRRVGQPWETSTEGVYVFSYEGRISVRLQIGHLPNLVQVHATLCPLPPEGSAAFYKKLFKAHFFGLDTAGASFGLSTTTNEVIFYRVVEADRSNEKDFILILRDFVYALDAWQQHIKQTAA